MYLTPKAVAERLAVSDRTVRRWMAEGDLPALLLPSGDYRVDPAALAAWERERQELARCVAVKDTPVRKQPETPYGRWIPRCVACQGGNHRRA